MRRIGLVAGRELASFLSGSFGWVIVALVLALDGVLFNGLAMQGERPSSEVTYWFFYFSSGVTMTASVFVAMRTLAGEREHGTLVLLQTAPLSEWELVLGKYLGALGFLAILVLGTFYMPLLVLVNGQLPWGQVAAGYLGLLLLGSATTAIGVFGSAISRSQVLAVVVGGVLVVFLLTTWWLSRASDPPLDAALGHMALYNKHFKPFTEGSVRLASLVFYPSVAFVFLLLSVRALEARRWR